jgi:hypothetical protein
LKDRWVPHDERDEVVDFVALWSSQTELPALRFIRWLGIHASKFFDWKTQYGKANEHNAQLARDHWLEPQEVQAIIAYAREHPLAGGRRDGYRRLAFVMLDENVVAASPATVYRVLKGAGLLNPWQATPSRKGTGFVQPLAPHEHWHVDIAYLNICGTFYYLCIVLERPRLLAGPTRGSGCGSRRRALQRPARGAPATASGRTDAPREPSTSRGGGRRSWGRGSASLDCIRRG